MNSVGLLLPDVKYYSAQRQGMDSFLNEFIEIMQNFCPFVFQVRSQAPRSQAQRSCAHAVTGLPFKSASPPHRAKKTQKNPDGDGAPAVAASP